MCIFVHSYSGPHLFFHAPAFSPTHLCHWIPEWHRAALWSLTFSLHGCLEPYPAGFWHTQGWRLHNLSGHLFQCLPSLKVKEKIFLPFKWSFLYFTLCPLPLILSVHPSEKTLAPSFFTPPPPLFIHFDKIPLLSFDKTLLFFFILSVGYHIKC